MPKTISWLGCPVKRSLRRPSGLVSDRTVASAPSARRLRNFWPIRRIVYSFIERGNASGEPLESAAMGLSSRRSHHKRRLYFESVLDFDSYPCCEPMKVFNMPQYGGSIAYRETHILHSKAHIIREQPQATSHRQCHLQSLKSFTKAPGTSLYLAQAAALGSPRHTLIHNAPPNPVAWQSCSPESKRRGRGARANPK